MPKAVMPVGETGRWFSRGSPGAGARAHHRFGSLTILLVAPSSSQECGDPRGDKYGSLTTREVASVVSISHSTLLMRDKGPHRGKSSFLCPCPFSLGLLPFRWFFLKFTLQSGAWPHGFGRRQKMSFSWTLPKKALEVLGLGIWSLKRLITVVCYSQWKYFDSVHDHSALRSYLTLDRPRLHFGSLFGS